MTGSSLILFAFVFVLVMTAFWRAILAMIAIAVLVVFVVGLIEILAVVGSRGS